MPFASAAQVLIDEKLLRHEVSLGVAARIADGTKPDELSTKQRTVYERYIEPLFQMVCATRDCFFEVEDQYLAVPCALRLRATRHIADIADT